MTWWRRWCASCRTTWAPSAPPSPSSSSRPSGSGSATQSSYSQTRISTSRYMKVQGSNPASNDDHWYLLNLLCNIIKPIQWFSTIYLFSNVKTTMHSYRGSYWLPWLTIQYDTISSVGWCITILFPPSPTPPPPLSTISTLDCTVTLFDIKGNTAKASAGKTEIMCSNLVLSTASSQKQGLCARKLFFLFFRWTVSLVR